MLWFIIVKYFIKNIQGVSFFAGNIMLKSGKYYADVIMLSEHKAAALLQEICDLCLLLEYQIVEKSLQSYHGWFSENCLQYMNQSNVVHFTRYAWSRLYPKNYIHSIIHGNLDIMFMNINPRLVFFFIFHANPEVHNVCDNSKHFQKCSTCCL